MLKSTTLTLIAAARCHRNASAEYRSELARRIQSDRAGYRAYRIGLAVELEYEEFCL